MAGSLGSLTVDLNADVAKFVEAMTKAEHVTKQFAERAEKYVVGAAAGIGAAFALSSMKNFIDQTVEATAKLDDLSEISGTTVERLSSWGGVAKMAGVGLEEVTNAVTKMSKGLMAADEETKGAGAALAYLGIEAKTATGQLRDPGEVIEEVAKKLSEFKDGAGKTALAMDLLGKSGAQMLPFLKDLAEEGQLQVKVTAEQAAQAEHYEKTLVRLESQKKAVFKVIAMELIPAMDQFATAMLNAIKDADGMRKAAGDLAKDGTIKEWANSAADAVAFVIDAFDGVARAVEIVGKGFGAMFAASDAKNFKQAGEMLKEYGRDVDAILNRKTFRQRLKEVRNPLDDGSEGDEGDWGHKRQLGYTRAEKDKTGRDTELRKYIQALQQEEEKLIAINGLGEVEAMIYKLTAGSLADLTDAHKAEILAVAGEIEEYKRAKEWAKALADTYKEQQQRQDASNEAIAQFNEQSSLKMQQIEHEIGLIGKTAAEQEKLRAIEQLRLNELQALKQVANDPAAQEAILAESAALKEKMLPAMEKRRSLEREWQTGMQNGLNGYIDMVTNAAAQTESLIRNAFSGMEDALVKFVQTGKLDFKSLADSIISDIIRIQIRQSITAPLANAMKEGGGLGGLLAGGLGKLFGGGGGGVTGSINATTDMNLIGYASGGDPPVGVPSIVGENGPELFVPKAAGTIIPNGSLGGSAINLSFAPRIDSRTDQATIMMLMRQQSAAMMAELAQRFNRNGASSMAAALG